jgi:peptidyl-prolyl cis-trans isomerase D
MFDLVRNNKKFIQLVLAFIMLPFALWGVDSYVRTGSSDGVATVGGTPIALGEFQQALREQQDRLRPQLGNVSQDVLDSPEVRRGVLEELISQRLLALYASQSKLMVSDEALVRFITAVPSLQEDGKFSRERYQALVSARGMSVEMFESQVKRDLVMQQAMIPVGNAAVSGRIPSDSWLAAQLEEREVSETLLRAEQFAADSKPDAAAIKRFYDENRQRFEKPEQVRVEYLVLSQSKLIENAKPGDEEIKAWYKSNETRYKQAEQRQASHILIRADKSAPEADVKAGQAKAEQILAQLKANPADFAKLAKQHSQDPGSAEKGGDLGYFGRGMMVKPFEETVFSLKENQLSDVVRSDFGFHLIKLTGVRAEQVRPLAAVRDEIVAEMKRQAGTKLYAELAEGFANIVYEQSDSLKPAAEKYGLTIQASEWIAKGGQSVAPFTSPKLLQTIFSDDAIKSKRNTEAVDVGGNTLVSARVAEYRPAALEPLESVSNAIEKVLTREFAITQAGTVGQAHLDKLKKGEKVNLTWSAVRPLSRMHAPNLSAEARNAIFSVSTKKLPAYVGANAPGGFALYRIDSVKPFDSAAGGDVASRSQALRQHYGQVIAQEDLMGWLAALRQRYPVTINTAALERK